jgi:hypothetical protein
VEPDTGIIEAGGSADFVATMDASDLEPDTYVTNILIKTDDETDKVVVLPVNLDIIEASGVSVKLPTATMPLDQRVDLGLGLDNNSRINTSISEASLSISFDPEFLDVEDIVPTARVEHMAFFQWLETEPGTVTLSISDATGHLIAPGTEDIAFLSLRFHSGTSCGDSLELMIGNVMLADSTGTPVEATSHNGLVISLCKGDVDADGTVTVKDVLQAIQFILHTPCIDDWTPECWAADFNGDGTVNVTDLVGMINVILEN